MNATDRTIPIYSADGTRLRNRALASIDQLLADGKVVVERNRRGRIVCATFRPARQAAGALRQKPHAAPAYSYPQALPSGRKAWRFSALITADDLQDLSEQGVSAAEADRYVRGLFLTVSASVMAAPPAPVSVAAKPRRRAEVICISSVRRRPVEFDSGFRKAA